MTATPSNASSKLTIVRRHALTRALHSDPTVLGLVQGQIQILYRAALLPHTGPEGVIQAEVQHSLHQAQPVFELSPLRIVGSCGQRGFHTL